MKVVAYRRVSTDKQAEHGFGMEIQGETITRWCQQNGHRIALWCDDAGESGATGLEGRLGLVDALDAVKARSVRGLVVARLDRLARDLVLQETLLADVRRNDGRIFSCAAGENAYLEDDPQDPSRTMIRQILGAVAQWERAMIRMRTDAGRARKLAEGGYAHGAPPYGYRAHDGELVPVQVELDAIAMMRAMRDAGGSWRQIVKHLTDSGVPASKGGSWYPNTVRRIVERDEKTTAA